MTEALDERLLMRLSSDVTERTGWFGAALGVIYGLAVGNNAKSMLEIGVGFGGSTRALLLAAHRTDGTLTSVDNRDCMSSVPHSLQNRWQFLQATSQEISKTWGRSVDLLFIDGDHTYDAVRNELRYLGRFVRPGGLILMDDCFDMFPGVLAAFDEAKGEKYLLPYGTPATRPGGTRRALGVLRVTQKPIP